MFSMFEKKFIQKTYFNFEFFQNFVRLKKNVGQLFLQFRQI